MATFNGVNYKKVYVDDPSGKANKGEYNGHKKVLFDEITFDQDVIADDDIIKIGKLPAGARVLKAVVKSDQMGTTGIFNFGHAASESGDISADEDAFVVGADAGGQAVQADGEGAGIGVRYDEAVEVQLQMSEATDAANGDTVQAWVEYVVD